MPDIAQCWLNGSDEQKRQKIAHRMGGKSMRVARAVGKSLGKS